MHYSKSGGLRNPCKTYPDEPCYGCKRNTTSGMCSIFYNMEVDLTRCPCVKCLVKPMCVKVCDRMKTFVNVALLKGGIAV